MAKLTKKQKEAQSKIEKGKAYTVAEASALIKAQWEVLPIVSDVSTAQFRGLAVYIKYEDLLQRTETSYIDLLQQRLYKLPTFRVARANREGRRSSESK